MPVTIKGGSEPDNGLWTVTLERDLAKQLGRLYVWRVDGDKLLSFDAATVTAVKTQPGMINDLPPFIAAPYLELESFLQGVLECAWNLGLRPGDYKDECPSELKAVRDERDFLRALVSYVVCGPMPEIKKQDINPEYVAQTLKHIKGP